MKRALGRGLGALLPPAETEDAGRLRELPTESLVPNPQQPRKTFRPAGPRGAGGLDPGLRGPPAARRPAARARSTRSSSGSAAGGPRSRRGWSRVPAIVREASDAEALELGLVENLLREDLNPLEAADAYQRLLAEFGWTQEELARRLGKDRSSDRQRAAPPPAPRADPGRPPRRAASRWGMPGRSWVSPRRRRSSASASGSCPGLVGARDRGRRPGPAARVARRRAGAAPDLEALEEELRQALGTAGPAGRDAAAGPDRAALHLGRGARADPWPPDGRPDAAAELERIHARLDGPATVHD